MQVVLRCARSDDGAACVPAREQLDLAPNPTRRVRRRLAPLRNPRSQLLDNGFPSQAGSAASRSAGRALELGGSEQIHPARRHRWAGTAMDRNPAVISRLGGPELSELSGGLRHYHVTDPRLDRAAAGRRGRLLSLPTAATSVCWTTRTSSTQRVSSRRSAGNLDTAMSDRGLSAGQPAAGSRSRPGPRTGSRASCGASRCARRVRGFAKPTTLGPRVTMTGELLAAVAAGHRRGPQTRHPSSTQARPGSSWTRWTSCPRACPRQQGGLGRADLGRRGARPQPRKTSPGSRSSSSTRSTRTGPNPTSTNSRPAATSAPCTWLAAG